MSVFLADLGGTHFRLARASKDGLSTQRFKIADYPSLDDLLRTHAPDISCLYLASATAPRDGKIEDLRFHDKSHWIVDLEKLRQDLRLDGLFLFNDLEAAAYALAVLTGEQLSPLVPAAREDCHFTHSPRLLVGVGTGIGHAYLFDRGEGGAFVQNTHGGHIPLQSLTPAHADVIARMKARHPQNRDWIVEDIVSGHGLLRLSDLFGEEDAIRLFWEFLGLYCNALVSLPAAYGGLYFTGGVIDRLVEEGKVDTGSFKKYFIPAMVPVVQESLSAVPVYYCREPHMPIVGLNHLYWTAP